MIFKNTQSVCSQGSEFDGHQSHAGSVPNVHLRVRVHYGYFFNFVCQSMSTKLWFLAEHHGH